MCLTRQEYFSATHKSSVIIQTTWVQGRRQKNIQGEGATEKRPKNNKNTEK